MTVRRKPDPARLLPDVVHVELTGETVEADFAALAEIMDAGTPRNRIERLKRHPTLTAVADRLQGLLDAAGNADKGALADIASAEHHALYLDARKPAMIGHAHSEAQAQKGRKGALTRWQARDVLTDCINALAARRDELGDPVPTDELWPELFSALDDMHLRPREIPHTDLQKRVIEFNGQRITYGSFKNRISKAR